MLERSLAARGDTARLRHVLAKAARGEAITLGFIGGSITEGGIASDPSHNYVSRIASWWRTRFPQTPITVVNAGIGGTGSLFGTFRVGAELLSHDPDLVIVEYAVNDNWTDTEPFEGLIRQIVGHSSAPAVILLFMMWEQGGNCQDMQQPVGAHYDLPMISFRDAVWPEIKAGRKAWHDLIVDKVHPNDLGHLWASNFCTHFFESIPSAASQLNAAPASSLPSPLTSTRYAQVRWLPAKTMDFPGSNGWQLIHGAADTAPLLQVMRARATLKIDWTGSGLALVLNGPSAPLLSSSRVSIDGRPVNPMAEHDFVDRETVVLTTGLANDRHELRIETTQLQSRYQCQLGLRGLGIFSGSDAS
jgi:lysophospholipase L1-like esterase